MVHHCLIGKIHFWHKRYLKAKYHLETALKYPINRYGLFDCHLSLGLLYQERIIGQDPDQLQAKYHLDHDDEHYEKFYKQFKEHILELQDTS